MTIYIYTHGIIYIHMGLYIYKWIYIYTYMIIYVYDTIYRYSIIYIYIYTHWMVDFPYLICWRLMRLSVFWVDTFWMMHARICRGLSTSGIQWINQYTGPIVSWLNNITISQDPMNFQTDWLFLLKKLSHCWSPKSIWDVFFLHPQSCLAEHHHRQRILIDFRMWNHCETQFTWVLILKYTHQLSSTQGKIGKEQRKTRLQYPDVKSMDSKVRWRSLLRFFKGLLHI